MELRELANRAPRSADDARESALASQQLAEMRSGKTTVSTQLRQRPEATATTQPKPPKPPKPVMLPAESFGKSRTLTGYEYKLSVPELQRLRENNPKAADTLMTEVNATPLTWEAYDALPEQQRAAVDFNTLLVEAREEDLRFGKSLDPATLDQYNTDVKEMFGQAGGSEKVAPETVKLLKSINFKAVGQDLDEFLSLDRAVSTEELGNFQFSDDSVMSLESFDFKEQASTEKLTTPTSQGGLMASGHPANMGTTGPVNMVVPKPLQRPGLPVVTGLDTEKYAGVRSPENLLAIDTALIQGALNAYKSRLAAWEGSPWTIESSLGTRTEFLPSEKPAGYGRGEPGSTELAVDQALEDAYNMLKANPNESGIEALYKDFTDRSWTPEDKEMLWSYVDDRTRRELTYMDDKDAQMVRTILGWE